MAKRYLIYQEFYFADMVRDGWMEYISPEVAALCPLDWRLVLFSQRG